MRNNCRNIQNLVKLALVLLLILCGVSFRVRAQDDAIRVDTELVIVPATVLDNGKYVNSLKKEDFRIVENGVEQNIELFESNAQPITVLLLVDRSGSMTERGRTANKAVNQFIKRLRADDLVIIATFAGKPDLLFQPVRVGEIRGDIDLGDVFGKARFRIKDAPKHAVELMRNKIAGRKSIVLFSDGIIQTEERATADLLAAEARDTTVHTIQLDYPIDEHATDESRQYLQNLVAKADEFMRDLAQTSGGRSYKITHETIEKTFVEMADELENQYYLGYYPKQTEQKSKVRRIKIETRQPNLTIRARDAYVTDKP